MKKPIIIEFNGLPGLGKTTIANRLIENLDQLGYKTVDRHYRKNKLHTLRHPFPEIFSPSLYFLVNSFSKTLPLTGRKRTHLHWINFYSQKYLSIKKNRDIDFAIVDEGIIQFWNSIAYQDRIPASNEAKAIVKKLKSLGIEFIRVNCINNIEVSASRIITRPSRGIRIETLDYNEKLKTLETEAENFVYLRSLFAEEFGSYCEITIDTLLEPEDNAKKIQDYVLELL